MRKMRTSRNSRRRRKKRGEEEKKEDEEEEGEGWVSKFSLVHTTV
jgi:hypothetical protein